MVRTSGANVIISPCLVIDSGHVVRFLSALVAWLAAAAKKLKEQ